MQSLRQFHQLRRVVHSQLRSENSEPDLEKTSGGESPQSETSKDDTNAAIARRIPGIEVRERQKDEGGEGLVFVVRWSSDDDPMSPKNWPKSKRVPATMLLSAIALAVTATSSIDSAITGEVAKLYGISETAASLTTAMFLFGFGTGSLLAGSFSETFGRNFVYLVSMVIYMLFILASALAPSFGADLVLRFLSGFFGSTPLTVAGGTIADLYTPFETTWGFPLFSIPGFAGPLLGPIIASYIGDGHVTLNWTQWSMLILSGLVFALILLFQPETYAPLLLQWKAAHFRKATGDDRYVAESAINPVPLPKKLATNVVRPFGFVYTEPIVLVFALYLVMVYMILFTFLDGYTFIFADVYGISQGLTNLIFIAMLVGVFSVSLLVPFVYRWTKQEHEKAKAEGRQMAPEVRLWYAMLGGSVSIPISLFWVGWTCYPSVSIWVPIVGTAVFGYGLICLFTTAYMYIIDVYQMYAASALAFNAFSRYIVAGAMTVAGFPMYQNLGPHWACTLLGCLSALMVPVPYVLYYYGPAVRARSKNVVNRG